MGFYFSRELAGIISQKLRDTKKSYHEDIGDISEEFDDFKEDVTNGMISILRKLKENNKDGQ